MRAILALAPLLACVAFPASAACRKPGSFEAGNGAVRLVGQIEGAGPPVLLIPSLGRGPRDFDDLAQSLVLAGYSAIRFDPRWFGRSTGPESATLADLASDAAAVVEAACGSTKSIVIGHAFGNRVARMMAMKRSSRVSSIILLAAGGKVPIAPEITLAIGVAASEGLRADGERLAALQLAFFAPGQDASVWLSGWSPRAAELQAKAARSADPRTWWTAGDVRVLVLQPTEDPVAPVANAAALAAELGARASVVLLRHASHAILPEQPRAVSGAVIAWAKGERRIEIIQSIVDREIRRP